MSVLKQSQTEAYNDLYEALKVKSEFIRDKSNSNPTEAQIKFLQKDEQYIQKCLKYIETTAELIKSLETEIKTEKIKSKFLFDQNKQYLNQYYDVVDLTAEYYLVKAITK